MKIPSEVMGAIQEIEICRPAFVSTHGLKNGKMERVIKARVLCPTGAHKKDMRGRHPAPNKTPQYKLDKVHEHIRTLCVTASHYSRAHSPNRRYLDYNGKQITIFLITIVL